MDGRFRVQILWYFMDRSGLRKANFGWGAQELRHSGGGLWFFVLLWLELR